MATEVDIGKQQPPDIDLEQQIGQWENDGGSAPPERSTLAGQIDLAEFRKRGLIQDPKLLAEWKEHVEREDNQPMGG